MQPDFWPVSSARMVVMGGSTHFWGAHAPRVLAMTPSSSRTFLPRYVWTWYRRRTVLREDSDRDRRVGAGADEPLRETLPDDQPAKMTGENINLCREPCIIPDRLRLIQFSADEVGNLALVW
jgi:hypothetical protein